MPSILLALSDLGTAMPLQETLEAAGHRVTWDGARAAGPGDGAHSADVVILACDHEDLAGAAEAWRSADPPPGLLAVGSGAVDQQRAMATRMLFTDLASAQLYLGPAIEKVMALRYAGRMSPAYARGALGLGPATGDATTDAARIIERGRSVDIALVSECLRHYVYHYVGATDAVAALREKRALQIPEVGLVQQMNGTLTVQTLVRSGGLDRQVAARLLWSLISSGVATLSVDPPDSSTPERRALGEARQHLRARSERLGGGTLYDVLEVTPGATPEQVDSACRYLALRYGPEVLGRLDLGDLSELATKTWQQILAARQILYDAVERAKYNDAIGPRRAQLRSPWAFEASDPAAAEAAFRRGQKALVDGEVFKAVSAMATACRLHPEHPDYEASLCWARFRAELTRGKDRAEVIAKERGEAEATLRGRRPWPRALVALGLLCAADSDPDAAQWHLHEALRCDPSLPAAKQLLRRLGR